MTPLARLVAAAQQLLDFIDSKPDHHYGLYTGKEVVHCSGKNEPHNVLRAALAAMPKEAEKLYPCAGCGLMRNINEGGRIFTICDACWDKPSPPEGADHAAT